MEQLGNSREKELASNVDSSLEAVESIISALLDISRLDTGALKPVVSVFRLDALLQQIARDFSPMAREKGLDLRVVANSAVVATDVATPTSGCPERPSGGPSRPGISNVNAR